MSEKTDKEYSTEKEQMLAKAKSLWAMLNAKKYPDDKIEKMITAAYTVANKKWSIANALTALAMIAYNQMIDEKVSKAKKSCLAMIVYNQMIDEKVSKAKKSWGIY